MRNFMLSVIVFLLGALCIGCLSSPQKDEAARLIAEAVAFVEQERTESGSDDRTALDRYRNALDKVEEVLARFPSSFWAEQLRTGQKKIGSYTLEELYQTVDWKEKEKIQVGETPLSSALLLANNIEDTTTRGELLGAIARQYFALGDQTRVEQIVKLSGEASEGVLTAILEAALASENDVQALLFARSAPNAESRDSALGWLCREQIRRGRLAEARLTVEEMTDPATKTEALTTLALVFMAAGEVALSVDWLGWQRVEQWSIPKSLHRNVVLLHDKAEAEELLARARQVNADVADVEDRERLVVALAHGYGVVGQFAEAGPLLFSLTSRQLRARGLAHLALQQAATGRIQDALASLSAAQKEQQAIVSPAEKTALLVQLALGYVAIGQDEVALPILSGLKEEKLRSGVFAMLARKRASEGKLEEAIQFAQRVGDTRLRTKTISAIAQAYPKAEQTELGQTLLARAQQEPLSAARSYAGQAQCEQALGVAEGIGDFQSRLDTFFAIARTCVEKGQPEHGEVILTRALEAVRPMSDTSDKDSLLKIYVREAIAVGQFAQALRVAEALVAAQDRAEAFADVARMWHQAGDPEHGHACFTRALQEIRSIPELTVRTRMLGRLARSVIGAGNLMFAHHIVDLIEEVSPRSDLLSLLALVYEEHGDFEQAMLLIPNIPDEFIKAKTLAGLAQRAMRDNQLPRVLQLLGAIQHPRLKDQVLADLARWFHMIGRSADAATVVTALGASTLKTRLVIELVRSSVTDQMEDKALQFAATLEDDPSRWRALAVMALEYKRLGQQEYALRAAQRIPEGEERARIMKTLQRSLPPSGEGVSPVVVVREQIEKGQYQEAEAAIEQLERKDIQANVFVELACRHLQEGRNTKGSELLARAVRLAEEIEFSTQRVSALKNIVREVLAREQLPLALQAALSISRTEDRREVLAEGARELMIFGQYAQAARFAETLEDATRKAQLLEEVARKYLSLGNTESAMAVAQRVDNLPKKAVLFLRLVHVYADRGEKAKADAMLVDTTRMFLSLAEEDQRPLAKSLVVSHAQLGHREQAVRLAKGIRTATVRAEALADLARIEAEVGRYKQALQTVAEIDAPAVRATVLAEVARRQVAKGHYDQAFQTVAALDDTTIRAGLFLVIARQESKMLSPRLEELGNRASSVSTNEALSLSGDAQDRELSRIVRLYVNLRQKMPQALTLAETVKNLPLRALLFAEIGAGYARIKEQEKAAELFTQGLTLVGRMTRLDDRIKVLTLIGLLYEKVGNPGKDTVKKILRDLT